MATELLRFTVAYPIGTSRDAAIAAERQRIEQAERVTFTGTPMRDPDHREVYRPPGHVVEHLMQHVSRNLFPANLGDH